MEQAIETRVLTFIREHHIFTLAVSRDNRPWCATCYYVYLEDQNLFVFTSGHDTKHVTDVVETGNYYAAGAIALETRMTGKIRGIQFAGLMKELSGNELKTAKSAYLKAFPVARLAKLHLWGLEPNILKMTDNRLGFGKKLLWRSNKL
ncbi:MAG: pyridoxamine 5'-phosphate oxidase family protein [Bacteroidales bacterium]